ncbi:MAG TPA: DUF6364 family protein [Spirochaetota bacterium]|nr:DUF6364 family protein [Spirochaetota bacterium]
MNSKLTLYIDKKVITQAKQYARKNKTSISEVVEKFLESLVDNHNKYTIAPITKELSNIIVKKPKKINYKREIEDYLLFKYDL